MFKFILSYFWGDDSTDLSLDEAYEVLDSAKEDVEKPEKENPILEDPSEYSCFHKNGAITAKENGSFIIDHIYKFQSNLQNLEVGSLVSFTIYTSDGKVKVSDVTIQDDWACRPNNDKSSWCTRSLICKVTKRDGRQVSVTPGDITIDLNTVSSEFIPIVGDWVDLEAKVELDESVSDLFGKVLEVQKIRPLRPRILEGRVRQWSSDTKTGAIDRVVFFNEDALSSGYVPIVGDKVVTEAIESEQGMYACRSLKIIPEKQTDTEVSVAEVVLPEFEVTQEGLFVSEDVFIKAKKLGETLQFEIKVMNTSTSNEDLLLLSVSLPSSSSQCVIIRPSSLKGIRIAPGKSVRFEGLCTVKNMGRTRELVLFSFVNVSIGRWVTVHLDSNREGQFDKAKSADRGSIMLARTQFNKSQSELVRGQKLTAPPRFISARLPDYPVPQKLLAIVSNHYGVPKNYELIEEIRLAKPCLSASFSFNVYEDRFHTLLHLEEIQQIMAIRSYAQDQACFIQNGEYLMLEIENLSEKRPSLIIGDRIIAKDPYKEDAFELEGYIHKVGAKHVHIKFAQMFHDAYNGEDMSIMVVASRTAFRRLHQAVGLAVRNLGNSFLFPVKVPCKESQTNFVYDEYYDNIHTTHKKIETQVECIESDASNSSDNNNTSFEKIVALHKQRLSLKKEIDLGAKKTNRNKEILNSLRQHALPNSTNSNIGNKQVPIESQNGNNEETKSAKAKFDSLAEPEQSQMEIKSQLLLVSVEEEPKLKYDKKGFSKKYSPKHNNKITVDMLKPTGPLKLEWYNKSLNYYQKEAVRNILLGEARPLPYFIFGPPGTGKTVTLVETILQLLRLIPHSRLLVATPSNSAADLIALRLIDSGVLKPGDLIRLVAYRCVVEDLLPVKLIPYCATADIAREGTHGHSFNTTSNGLTLGCNSSVIGRHRVTVGTCSSLGVLFSMGFSKGHFTHIILDEAGQATEPEVMIPLSLLDVLSGQVILAGDPLQLGPVIESKVAIAYGLEETYLDRMLSRFPYVRDTQGFTKTGGYDPRLITKLVYNYRSLPDVLVLASNMFYNGQLISTISPTDSEEAKLLDKLAEILPIRKNSKPPAVVFHGVMGGNYQTADSPSWFNPNEASQIFYYVNELYRFGLKSTDIGIISPYIKQVKQIRALLNEAEFDVPKVGTVEEFQGQEFNVILLSTVRSSEQLVEQDLKHKIGFLSNPRRVNVAITRAQALMIIVGNPQLLCSDPHWRNVIRHCVENGSYCGCDLSCSD